MSMKLLVVGRAQNALAGRGARLQARQVALGLGGKPQNGITACHGA